MLASAECGENHQQGGSYLRLWRRLSDFNTPEQPGMFYASVSLPENLG